MEKFSVLMSVYYKETPKFLDLSLKSILEEQTLKPTEVVLVKDGKLTSELDEVIEKYRKTYGKQMNVVSLKKNQGLGKALQIGLEKCKYDLVARMDSDDISVYNRFEKQIDYMEKHPNVTAVGSYIGEFENNTDEPLRLKKIPVTYDEILEYAKMRNPMNHVTVCFRKKDILEVGSYQPLQYLEDHYLWARLLAAGKILQNIPEILVCVRVGNGFTSRRGSRSYIAGWKKLQNYLYEHHLINRFHKMRNIMAMYAMVYMPRWCRSLLYNYVLRTKGRTNLSEQNGG